jgi:hypothetical protein
MLLPPDLLIAALAARSGTEPPSDRVSLVTSHLAHVLSSPVADTHLHVGAAMSFGLLWSNMMWSLGAPKREDRISPKDLEPEGPPPFGSGKGFFVMLLAAAIGRVLLASFLRNAGRLGERGFHRFLHDDPPAWCLRRIGARADDDPSSMSTARELLESLDELCTGPATIRERPLSQLTALYRRLLGLPTFTPSKYSELASGDPLSDLLPGRPALPETRFARLALEHLATSAANGHFDEEFAYHFWQYQRVRCLTYRHLTQEPGVGGLDWFSRHFRRVGSLRKSLNPLLTACALEHQGYNLRLASLEMRTSPERSWTSIWQMIRAIASQALDHNRKEGDRQTEVGLVLHFIKEREWGSDPIALHGDPAYGCRFGYWYKKRAREVSSITGVLERHPEAMLLLRGVDVASSELAMPTWPTLPLLGAVREASAATVMRLSQTHPDWHIDPMRVTYHAGEDYRRLVEGVRRVHELIEFDALQAGDRIGHGLAIGDAPERWDGVALIAQPAEERLDDLLWELDRYGHGDLLPTVSRVELVRFQAYELAQEIYGAQVDVNALAISRRRRHDKAALQELGFPYMLRPPRIRDTADELLWRYLTCPRVFERGQRPIEVKPSKGEIAMLHEAQRWLRGVLSRMEITVESNPSSNLLIGSFFGVDEHPAFRLQPLPGSPSPSGSTVLLSVNVDDPVTFASRLADEYAYLYFALLRSDVPSQDALSWLDQLRQNGWRSRFTLQDSKRVALLSDLVGKK